MEKEVQEILSVQRLIDDAIAKKDKEKKKERSDGKIHPSSLGRCFRFQYWNRQGVSPTNPPDARTLRVFHCGNLFHDFVQQFLPEHQCEVTIEDVDLIGRADIVTKDTVWDLKSQSSRAFTYCDKMTIGEFRQSKRPNWLQLACYAKYLKKPYMRLCFISKDDLRLGEYKERYEDWEDALEEELEHTRFYWAEGKLPEAKPRAYWNEKKQTFAECGYCGFRDKCKEVENGNMQ